MRCLEEGLSLSQIGRRAGRAPSTVSYHLKKHGLSPAKRGVHANKGPVGREVVAALVEGGATMSEIARAIDRSPANTRYWLAKFDLLALSASVRRTAAREALAAGVERPALDCGRHGPTTHVLEGHGTYRCWRCRSENVAAWRRQAKRRLVEEAGGRCITCGYKDYLGALEFHHLDPKTKSFGLSWRGLTRSMEQLRAEAEKCVLLCSNCHAEVEGGHRQLPPG